MQLYTGLISLIWGLFLLLYNKRATTKAVAFHTKYFHKLHRRDIDQRVGRIGYIIVGLIFMIAGAVMMINAIVSR